MNALLLAAALLQPAQDVTVGVYVNRINELSLRDNRFVLDCYVWFRWKNEALKPYETFSIVDGVIESRSDPDVKQLPDGSWYVYLRLVVKVTKFWDLSDFPLDHHELQLVIEEESQEDHKLRYAADVQNSMASPDIDVTGWEVASKSLSGGVGTYRTNFGDLSLPTGAESRYARATFTITMRREGGAFAIRIFFGVWIASAISFLVFFIKPTNVDPRFGLGVGALFAAIASEYMVTSSLPDTSVITLADTLHLIAFGFIFITVAQSTVSLWMAENDRVAGSKVFDRFCGLALPIFYVGLNVWLLARV